MGDARRLLRAAHVLLEPIPVSRARQRPYLLFVWIDLWRSCFSFNELQYKLHFRHNKHK